MSRKLNFQFKSPIMYFHSAQYKHHCIFHQHLCILSHITRTLMRLLSQYESIQSHSKMINRNAMDYNLSFMQVSQKKWKKVFTGNKVLAEVKNPLRNFVEKELPSIDLKQFPGRPAECLNLSIGDPTTSLSYRTSKDNLDIFCKNVGKIDGYTNMQGLDQARIAVAQKFSAKSFKTSKDDVYLTAGGSLAIWVTMNLLAGDGDNFLFPSPGFPLSLTIAKSMKLEPRFYHLQADNKWKPSVQEVQSLIDERTKFILVNDPSNPLGSSWSAEDKKALIDLSIRRKLPILVDEIYEGMLYGQKVPTFAQLVEEEQADGVILFKCSGLTKRYLGPGWRMGWIILYASKSNQDFYRPFIRGILNVILMPNTVVQKSVPQILASPSNNIRMEQCMDLMKLNQQTLKEGLKNEEDYCSFGHAAGALYATVILKLERFDESIKNSVDFAKLIYAAQNIKIFPGDFFRAQIPFIRLVISCEHEKIVIFLQRFIRFCKAYLRKAN